MVVARFHEFVALLSRRFSNLLRLSSLSNIE